MDETDLTTGSLEDPTGDPEARWTTPVEEETEHVTPLDVDGDGGYDAAYGFLAAVGTFALLDSDANGVAEYIEVDTDGDGKVDVTLEAVGDSWHVQVDLDQDGLVDSDFTITSEDLAAQLPALWQVLAGDPAEIAADPSTDGESSWSPEVEDGQIVGDPFAYDDLWFEQAFDGSCLPASVAQIYGLYTGTPVTDLAFVELVNEHGGWVVDEEGVPGLYPEAAVALLESVGIDASIRTSDLDGLTSALEQGYAVMVAVDSGEIWYGEAAEGDAADHALLVAGIDEETGTVYLSDTGTADGNVLAVPLETFMDSWQDSGNTMVVTEETVAEHRGEVAEDVAPPPQDVTQVPADGLVPSGAAADSEAVLPGADLTAGLPELLEGIEPTPLEEVTAVLVQHPWILLPVALVGARLVTRSSR